MKIKTITVFCPRGCNVLTISEERKSEECGACGSLMTPEDRGDFEAVHERGLEAYEQENN